MAEPQPGGAADRAAGHGAGHGPTRRCGGGRGRPGLLGLNAPIGLAALVTLAGRVACAVALALLARPALATGATLPAPPATAAPPVAPAAPAASGGSLPAPPAASPLSREQQAWLAQHPGPRFAPEHDYPPFIFVNAQGRLDGLSLEMLQLVQRHTGLALTTLPARPLAELLAQARARQADVLSSLRPTPERSAFLLFTQPYVRVPAVLVLRQGDARTLAELGAQPVAVGAGYAVEPVVRARHPAVQWQAVSDDVQALQGVVAGRYVGAVTDAASLAHIVRAQRLPALYAAERLDFEYQLGFAVRSDWPQLRDILDAGLRAIPADERRALMARWMPEQPEPVRPPPHAPRATLLGLLLLALALGWLLWRHRQRRAAAQAAPPR